MMINQIKEYLNRIKEYPILLNQLKELELENSQLEINKIAFELQIDDFKKISELKINDLTKEIGRLISEQELLIKRFNQDIKDNSEEKKQNGKYPVAKIYYEGRSLPFSKTKISFPVNVLITPTEPRIVDDLKRWKLYQTEEDYETLIPKIYKNIFTEYYKYDYDKNVWGETEVWEFPSELFARYKKGKITADCDSFAILIKSYLLSAGVSDWRVRVVAGDTFYGGHATVYVYSSITKKYHHFNSTFGGILKDKVCEYPTHQDARDGKDKIGITKVWFSLNYNYSWYNFDDELEIKDIIITK